jgi:hypothetical protein
MICQMSVLIIFSGHRYPTQQGPQGPQDQTQVPGYLFEPSCQGKTCPFIVQYLSSTVKLNI